MLSVNAKYTVYIPGVPKKVSPKEFW